MKSRFTVEEMIAAYERTGSVWRAAKDIGVCGQSLWERLRAVNYPFPNRRWTSDEIDEMQSLVASCTVGDVARRLGRTYASVACKMSELELPAFKQIKRKIPRASGFDKASTLTHMRTLEKYGGTITTYCRSAGLSIDLLVLAIQRDNAPWWDSYTATHTNLPMKKCEYCNRSFFAMSGKQRMCTRACQGQARTDKDYFGGNRRNTIGLAERQCQLCERVDVKGLSSHHMIGKQNDPENAYLIALCPGCHSLVGQIAIRDFADNPQTWENLINLSLLRRSEGKTFGYFTSVEIESLTEDEAAEVGETL